MSKRKKRLATSRRTRMTMRTRVLIGVSLWAAACALVIFVNRKDKNTDEDVSVEGAYRTRGTGDWGNSEVWERYDGSAWIDTDEPPGRNANSITIANGSELVVSEEATAGKVTIEKGGKLILHTNTFNVFKSGGKGGIFCKGELFLDDCVIEGNGDFKLYDEAILHIGSAEGLDKKSLSGNIQLKGAVDLSKKATYIFDGTMKQSTGDGMPSFCEHLIIKNESGVFMQSDLAAGVLDLQAGCLYTGPSQVKIGNSVNTTGSIIRNKGYVRGKLSKWYNQEEIEKLELAAGDESGVYLFGFTTEESQFKKGLIELKYHPGKPDEGFTSPFDAKQIKVGITEFGYFTVVLSNGPDDALLIQEKTRLNGKGENVSLWKIVRNDDAQSKNENANMSNFLLGPNPFTESFLVTFQSEQPTMATMQLLTRAGKIVHSETVPVEKGKNQYEFKNGADLPAGDYLLRISNPMEIYTLPATKK